MNCEMNIDQRVLNRITNKVYSLCSETPEANFGVGDPLHGMSGTSSQAGFRSSVMDWFMRQGNLHEVVFIDLGSGKGQPTLCMACLPIKWSLGVELNPLLTAACNATLLRLIKQPLVNPLSPTCFVTCDISVMGPLSHVTHVFSSCCAMPNDIRKRIAAIVAWSPSVRWAIVNDLNPNGMTLVDAGFFKKGEKIPKQSVTMTGSSSYTLFFIEISDVRRSQMREMYKVEPKPSDLASAHMDKALSTVALPRDEYVKQYVDKIQPMHDLKGTLYPLGRTREQTSKKKVGIQLVDARIIKKYRRSHKTAVGLANGRFVKKNGTDTVTNADD
jgi:hypothetical protein